MIRRAALNPERHVSAFISNRKALKREKNIEKTLKSRTWESSWISLIVRLSEAISRAAELFPKLLKTISRARNRNDRKAKTSRSEFLLSTAESSIQPLRNQLSFFVSSNLNPAYPFSAVQRPMRESNLALDQPETFSPERNTSDGCRAHGSVSRSAGSPPDSDLPSGMYLLEDNLRNQQISFLRRPRRQRLLFTSGFSIWRVFSVPERRKRRKRNSIWLLRPFSVINRWRSPPIRSFKLSNVRKLCLASQHPSDFSISPDIPHPGL